MGGNGDIHAFVVCWKIVFYVNFVCMINLADFIQVADVSDDFCELHCISAKLLRYMCVKVAHMNICIGKTRATYILYRENLHDLHICVFIVFLNLNSNLCFNIRSEGV